MAEPMEIDVESMEVDEQKLADSMPADLWMMLLSYTNAIDACRLQTVSKRLFYLVHQSQMRAAPQLVVSQGNVRDCVTKLSRPPTLALASGSSTPPPGLPPTTVAVGANQAISGDISNESLMMTTFSRGITKMLPFWIMDAYSQLDRRLFDSNLELLFCIVYGCADESLPYSTAEMKVDRFIHALQKNNCMYSIVGGIVKSGYVTLPCNCKYKVQQVDKGIFGVAFFGYDVPVSTYVSRGVGYVDTSGPWRVRESEFVVPQTDYMVVDDRYVHVPSYHRIISIENEFGFVVDPVALFAVRWNGWTPDFVGVKNWLDNDYELHPFQQLPGTNAMIVIAKRGHIGARTQIDFFHWTARMCLANMDSTVREVREQLNQNRLSHTDVIGGLMFTSILRDPLTDLNIFQRHFPGIPCMKVDTDCQIGPRAVVLDHDEYEFEQFGDCVVQMGTAVLVLFSTPFVDPIPYTVDDNVENVNRFLQTRQRFRLWSQWEQQFGWRTALADGDSRYGTQWCRGDVYCHEFHHHG